MTELIAAAQGMGDPELFEQWGQWYFVVQFFAVAFTAFVPPFPSEIMVIASGSMAAEGLMSISAVLAVTTAGCLVGDVGVYLLFRYQLIRLLHRFKWGRMIHRKLLRLTIRAGDQSTWIGLLLIRAVPGGRCASMATAGMMRLTWPYLVPLALVGALTWAVWLAGLGYITGTTTGLPPWASTVAALGVGTLVAVGIAVVAARRRRSRHSVA